MTSLWYVSPRTVLTVSDAVEASAALLGDHAVGWVSSATSHHMIRLDNGVLEGPDGPVESAGVFSARVFTEHAELRWQHVGGGVGCAVLLTEDDSVPHGWERESTGKVAEVIDGRYALWGRRFDPRDARSGWVRALEGRIGWLDVPVVGRPPESTSDDQKWPTEYLALHCREYVGLDDHDNAQVFEERLLRISPAESAVRKGP